MVLPKLNDPNFIKDLEEDLDELFKVSTLWATHGEQHGLALMDHLTRFEQLRRVYKPIFCVITIEIVCVCVCVCTRAEGPRLRQGAVP